MRISFVLPEPSLAGGMRVIAEHARQLVERGHEVLLVSQPAPPSPLSSRLRNWWQGGLVEASHLDGLPVAHHRLERARAVTDSDLPDADAVIATFWRTAPWVAKLSPSKGVRCFFIQGYESHCESDVPAIDAAWRLPLHKIVVSRWLEQLSCRRFGDDDVSLVPNGVNTGTFHAPPRCRQSVPTVGVVYSAARCKGLDVALDACAMARVARPNLRLLAFGSDRPDSRRLLPAWAEYHRRPAQQHLRELYAQCDAWLFPSRQEGFGLPILEAMACRTPVIAAPAGAAPELLADGGGVLLPRAEARLMADAIVQVSTLADAQWQTLSRRAYETAAAYPWSRATDLFEASLYRAKRKRQVRASLLVSSP